MKYIKQYEDMYEKDKSFKVKIKPNTQHKSTWYYGWLNKRSDLTDKIVNVRKSNNPDFDHHYCYNDSQFIDIDDCIYIGQNANITKYNL